MARLAILASGNGSNFEAIAKELNETRHHICCLVCDRKNAEVQNKARALSIPVVYVSYAQRSRESAEADIRKALDSYRANLVALAGFMRIFTPGFVSIYDGRILNIHPSLLPKYPGLHGIEEGYRSGDKRLGVTVHLVNAGVDTGPVLCQESLIRKGEESFEEIEKAIHAIEHRVYPAAIIKKLDTISGEVNGVEQ